MGRGSRARRDSAVFTRPEDGSGRDSSAVFPSLRPGIPGWDCGEAVLGKRACGPPEPPGAWAGGRRPLSLRPPSPPGVRRHRAPPCGAEAPPGAPGRGRRRPGDGSAASARGRGTGVHGAATRARLRVTSPLPGGGGRGRAEVTQGPAPGPWRRRRRRGELLSERRLGTGRPRPGSPAAGAALRRLGRRRRDPAHLSGAAAGQPWCGHHDDAGERPERQQNVGTEPV